MHKKCKVYVLAGHEVSHIIPETIREGILKRLSFTSKGFLIELMRLPEIALKDLSESLLGMN